MTIHKPQRSSIPSNGNCMSNMNPAEERRLMAYWYAQKNAPPRNTYAGMKSAKAHAKGVGQWLEKSFVRPQVGIERVYR